MKNKLISFFLIIMSPTLSFGADDFNPAINFSPDSISFVSYVSKSCYSDRHAGNDHADIINDRTDFTRQEDQCTKWYFREKYEDAFDQVGSIVYRRNKNQIIIGFRGSIYDKDWERNLQSGFLEEGNDISIHGGFKRRYEDIVSCNNENIQLNGMIQNILNVINSENINTHQLQFVVTGHSAGAAIATVAAFFIKRSNVFNLTKNQLCLITFSSPRVGNDKFADELKMSLGILNILRFTCSSDTVPHVPFEKSGYKHAGIEIPITLAEQAFDDDSTPERYLDYIRSMRLYKLIGYPVKFAGSSVSSILLQMTGSSLLIMHSMPSDSLLIEAFQYAQSRYHAGDCELEEIGYLPQISSYRRYMYIF